MAYAEVAVDAPAGYDRTFTYAIPSSMVLWPGHLVQVPFGPRVLHGVVMQVTDIPQVEAPREVLGLVEDAPLLSSLHLELARWVSHYYMAPLFEASGPMLPPGFRARSMAYVALTREPPEELPPQHQRLVDYLKRHGSVEESRLLRYLGRGSERVKLRSGFPPFTASASFMPPRTATRGYPRNNPPFG